MNMSGITLTFKNPLTDEVRAIAVKAIELYAKVQTHAKSDDIKYEWFDSKVIVTYPDISESEPHVFEQLTPVHYRCTICGVIEKH